jgi:hypothetical protein
LGRLRRGILSPWRGIWRRGGSMRWRFERFMGWGSRGLLGRGLSMGLDDALRCWEVKKMLTMLDRLRLVGVSIK